MREYVKTCDPYQRIRKPQFKHHWPLIPIILAETFTKWDIDFMGPFSPASKRKKNKYMVMAMKYFARFTIGRATKKNDVETTTIFLWEYVFMQFGVPLELVNDRVVHFLNDVIACLNRKYLVMYLFITPYNPKTNGLIE